MRRDGAVDVGWFVGAAEMLDRSLALGTLALVLGVFREATRTADVGLRETVADRVAGMGGEDALTLGELLSAF